MTDAQVINALYLAIPLGLLWTIVVGFGGFVLGNMRGYREGVEHRVEIKREDVH